MKDGELGGLQLFFPDPWHKAKHHKRRIVQPHFVEQVVQKLQPNGFIHMATDWENYAEQMLEVLSANENLIILPNKIIFHVLISALLQNLRRAVIA